MPRAFLFPGQGSQHKGMGADLFDRKEYRALESEVDALVGYSLRELCLEDAAGRLNKTQYTQPCLYVVNALHYDRAVDEHGRPDVVAGHSLGEYNALHAAGAFDFMAGLRLVHKRGELMAKATDGGMAAVVGLDGDLVHDVLRRNGLTDIDVANFNAPQQTILSGPTASLESARACFDEAGAKSCIPLPVSAAFHSRYMNDAAVEFRQFIAGFDFQGLDIPVVANVTGMPYPQGDPTITIRAFLARQIENPVKWTRTMRYLLEERQAECTETGPGQVLTKLIEDNRSEQQPSGKASGQPVPPKKVASRKKSAATKVSKKTASKKKSADTD